MTRSSRPLLFAAALAGALLGVVGTLVASRLGSEPRATTAPTPADAEPAAPHLARRAGDATTAGPAPAAAPAAAPSSVDTAAPAGPARATIRGRLVDPNGGPVSDAEVVCPWPSDLDLEDVLEPDALRVRTTRSAADGTFVFAAVAPGQRTLLVRDARGGGATSVETSSQAGRVLDLGDVIVPLGGTLAGIVRGPDGRPRGGARVRVRPTVEAAFFEAAALLSEVEVGWTLPETASGEDGRWAIGALPSGNVAVVARGEPSEWASLSPVEVSVGRTREDVDLSLRAGRTVEGTVSSHDGTASAGARVYVVGRESSIWTATADATGRFRLLGVEPDATDIGAHDRTLRLFAHATLGTQAHVEVRFPPVGALVGRVVAAETKRPVTEFLLGVRPDGDALGVVMTAVSVLAWTGEFGLFAPQRVVDTGGAFRIEAPVGSTTIVVTARGRMLLETVAEVAEGRPTDVGTLVMAPSRRVEGVVIDAAGTGVPDAEVCWALADDAAAAQGATCVRSGIGGEFRAEDLAPGRYACYAKHGERRGPSIVVDVRESSVSDLVLAVAPREDDPEPAGGLHVRVLDASGVEAAEVTITAIADGGRTASTTTDARGRASLAVFTGRWAVAVASAPVRKALADERRDAFDSAASLPGTVLVEVSDGRPADVVLRLPPLATVSGRVRVDGKAASGTVRLELGPDGEGSPRAVPTDATGAFTIRNVEPGDYRLHVDGHEEREGVNPIVVRVVDATEHRVDFSLPARAAPATPGGVACGDGKCG